jgi:hypothetical protein
MKGAANVDAQILIKAVLAAKELVAGSQIWLIETGEGPPALPAVNIDVWSKEKETSNERGSDNCGLGLNKGSKKDQRIQWHIIVFPHLPMFSADLFVFKSPGTYSSPRNFSYCMGICVI